MTTWQDSPGVRHLALAMDSQRKDPQLVQIFTPCTGYVHDAWDNTGTDETVTCVGCLTSRFADQCKRMNQDAIETLGEPELLDYFLDRDAMSTLYDA